MIKQFFWKTYQVLLVNKTNTLSHVQFIRGYEWDVVLMAIDAALKKTNSVMGWGYKEKWWQFWKPKVLGMIKDETKYNKDEPTKTT